MKKMKKGYWIAGGILLAVLLLIVAVAIYAGDYYRADAAAVEAFLEKGTVEPTVTDDYVAFVPKNATTGLVFYPGGKVDHEAYYPLMQALAEQEILCILLPMPLRLAVLDVNAADGVCAQFPAVEHWYIGGHSLGGSMAASYLADHPDDFEGLLLLASYTTADLSECDIEVLSIFGSEDLVLNAEKYEENKKNLPDDFMEYIIEGGCHAYFGTYGAQEGDGEPTVTNEVQIAVTAAKFAAFVTEGRE